MATSDDQYDIEDRALDAGLDIGGNVIGAGIGFALGGLPGALLGAAAAPVLKAVVSAAEVITGLSARQKMRVESVAAFTLQTVQARIAQGKKLRDDGFLREDTDDRSPLAEVAEAVITAAQRDHQEKKLRHYGKLLANIAFESAIDRAHANLLIRRAEQLSYSQLCILGLIRLKAAAGIRLRDSDYSKQSPLRWPVLVVLDEIMELYRLGLVASGIRAMFGTAQIIPEELGFQPPGELLAILMELESLESEDISNVVTLLQ